MLNIQTITESIQNEVKIDTEGKGTITSRGACLLLGINETSLVLQRMPVILVQRLIQYSFEPAAFGENGIPDVALGLIADY